MKTRRRRIPQLADQFLFPWLRVMLAESGCKFLLVEPIQGFQVKHPLMLSI